MQGILYANEALIEMEDPSGCVVFCQQQHQITPLLNPRDRGAWR